MTRQGKAEPSAAGARPPASDPRVSSVPIAAYKVTTNQTQGRDYRAEAQRRPLSASTSALPRVGRANPYIGRRSKSP
jgi:hypothetical protein